MKDGEECEERSRRGAHLRSFCPFGKWGKEEKQQKIRRGAGLSLALPSCLSFCLQALLSHLTTEFSVLMDFMCR